MRSLRLPVLACLIAAMVLASLILASPYKGLVNASQPTPAPPPLPPKTPIAFVSHRDAQKEHDRLPPENLAALGNKPCVNGKANDYYPCENVDLLSFLPLSEIGGGSASSSWGWTDPDTNKEYALLGRTNGTSFVDISDPKMPVYLGNLPSHTGTSFWRELKTYGYYALIVSDNNGSHGLQIFDLRQLRNVANPPVLFDETAHYAGFDNGHTITVNAETGYAYVNGSNTCGGGLHIIDVRDPLNPKFVNCFANDGYTHDAQCVTYHGPDTAYSGHEICFNANVDTLTVVDVTDKSNLKQLARQSYLDFGYVHQGWLTGDQKYFVLDDELDEVDLAHTAYTYIWNVQELEHPNLISTYHAKFRAIDHNQYIVGDRVYQADYRAGLRILDATNIAKGKLREVGFFDIFPANDDPNFNGAWNVYPFYASGVVTIAGIEQGLFVVKPIPEPNPPPCPDKPDSAALVSPRQDANVTPQRVPLSWDMNPCASTYKVILRQVTPRGNIVRQRAQVADTKFKTKKLEHTGNYLWTIRACNAWGCAKGTTRALHID